MGERVARARTRALSRVASAALLLTTTAAACSVPAADSSTPAPAQPPGALVGVDGLGLSISKWGVNDGLLSVLVENRTGRLLRRAELAVHAVDADGAVIAFSDAEGELGACCTVVGVPPGGIYGLYLAVDEDQGQVADVQLRLPDVAWSAENAPRGPAVRASEPRLRRDPSGAVVVAELDTVGDVVNDAIVQARINGPDGTFRAVVSGRWTCLRPGVPATADVELFHPVPAGSTVEGVSVFPLDAATLGDDATSC